MSKAQKELDRLFGIRKEHMELPQPCPSKLACFPKGEKMYNTVNVKLEPVITGWRKGFLGKLACMIGWHKGSIQDKEGWIKCDRCEKKYLNLYKKYKITTLP